MAKKSFTLVLRSGFDHTAILGTADWQKVNSERSEILIFQAEIESHLVGSFEFTADHDPAVVEYYLVIDEMATSITINFPSQAAADAWWQWHNNSGEQQYWDAADMTGEPLLSFEYNEEARTITASNVDDEDPPFHQTGYDDE